MLWIAAMLAASCVGFAGQAQAANAPSGSQRVAAPGRHALVRAERTPLLAEARSGARATAQLTRYAPVQILKHAGNFAEVETSKGVKGFVASKDLTSNPFLSISGRRANIRATSDGAAPILFEVYANYPLRVLAQDGRRLHVEDYEGDKGWVHDSLVQFDPYVIVRLNQINVRDRPGLGADGQPVGKRRFVAEKGVVFQVIEEKDGWLKIKHSDGDIGWCSGNIVWGYEESD